MTTRRKIAIGLAVAGAIAAVVLGIRAIHFAGRVVENQQSSTCQNHLRQLGGIYVHGANQGTPGTLSGAPLFVSYRREQLIATGREEVLTCPGDADVSVPSSPAESALYDTVDLSDAAALVPLCSYAARDFARYPVDDDGNDPETGGIAWIACDRQGTDGRTPHHRDGLNVLFANGAVQFKDREFLGIAESDAIIIGPDSPHPELRKMVFVATDTPSEDE